MLVVRTATAIAIATAALSLAGCSHTSSQTRDVKPPVVAQNSAWRRVINDWFRDGRIDHRYSCATLASAVAHLPMDGPEIGAPIRANERQRCGGGSRRQGIPSASGGRGANGQAGDPFEALPLVAPGQLTGRIRYLSNKDCELREYDLMTGVDTAISPSQVCAVGWPVLSPAGAAVAVRDDKGQMIVERVGASRLVLGEKTPHVRSKAQGNFVVLPTFSSDGKRIAFCTRSRTRLRTIVADVASGRTVASVTDSCETAFTTRGIAYLRGDKLLVRGRTILRLRGAAAANSINGIGPEGNPLVANPQGTLLALATRPLRNKVLGNLVTIHVLRPDGHHVASYRARIDITVGFQALAPAARSAVIWWGDILQLAAFGAPRGSLTLRYNLGPHSGDGERQIFPSGYSPDGAYAVMPRRAFAFHGDPTPATQPALILSAQDLQPLYRLPIDAQVAVWLAPAANP